MNTNIFHNATNFAIALLAGLEIFDWTPFLEESTALKVAGSLALLKLIINAIRDGVTGMVKHQPPVK